MPKIESVFVVDDDPIQLYTIEKLIARVLSHCKLTTFEDGKVAIDAVILTIQQKVELPDLILLDINMPIWDGWDFLDELSKQSFPHKKPLIFVISSSGSVDDKRKASSYAMVNGFIEKPLNPIKLLNAINID